MIAKLGQTVQPLFGRSWGNKGPMRSSSVKPHGWHQCLASQTWWRKMNMRQAQNLHIFEHSQGFFQSTTLHNNLQHAPNFKIFATEFLTSLQRLWHSIQGVVGSQWLCRVADPDCRTLLGRIWASLRCWAQAADSAPLPGPGHHPRDPTGCCWTLEHPGMCSANTQRSFIY